MEWSQPLYQLIWKILTLIFLYLGCVWLVPVLKTVDLADSEFVFDWLPNSENGRFGRFGRLAEHSPPYCKHFKRCQRDSRYKWGEFACTATVIEIELMQKLLPSTRLVLTFFSWKSPFGQDKYETCQLLLWRFLCLIGNVFPSLWSLTASEIDGLELRIDQAHPS